MLRILRSSGGECGLTQPGDPFPEDAVWIDLIKPTLAEEKYVEAALGLDIPTREEMAEIEISSRLYQQRGATYMTATLLCNSLAAKPEVAPVTFILAGPRLVTVRYVEPRSFHLFIEQAERQSYATGVDVFLHLMDVIIDRTADILEAAGRDVEDISEAVFAEARGRKFERILGRLGRAQGLNAKIRDSLVSLSRLISFAGLAPQIDLDPEHREHLDSEQRDVGSLKDYASYLSSNIAFLLDAALGLINIEQNSIIKIFSVAAVAFLPPTLIASIYGMNFEHMPELRWHLGYPMAIAAMVLSAVMPLLWFRRRGWL
jgi:magnesium transporter